MYTKHCPSQCLAHSRLTIKTVTQPAKEDPSLGRGTGKGVACTDAQLNPLEVREDPALALDSMGWEGLGHSPEQGPLRHLWHTAWHSEQVRVAGVWAQLMKGSQGHVHWPIGILFLRSTKCQQVLGAGNPG